MMSRFYGSLRGQAKTEATRRGGPSSGVEAHVRGWNTGVRTTVTADRASDSDTFYVNVTGGSNDGRRTVQLAIIQELPDGSARVLIDERFGGGVYDA